MAKKKDPEKKADPNRDLISKVRDCLKTASDADSANRRAAMLDLKFLNVPGEQWDQILRNERGDRICREYNKLRITAKRIINDMRANRPQGKVRAVEDGDKDTADVIEGLIRNIWNVSDGDTVIDYAAEYQVGGGYGAWRINTEYSTDTAFEQDIKVEGLKNPFCLYMDPAASDPLGRDAEYWILTERISKTSYEARWPKKEIVSFDGDEFDDEDEWSDGETVRICEYWYKEPATRTLYLTQDGKTVDAADLKPGEELQLQIARTRVVKCHKIMMCIVGGGDALLDKPTEWAGGMFPFVPVYGERMVIDGKTLWHGITRFAKDAQRSYNEARTAITETIAMAPQAKFWATPAQALGHTDKWAEAHKKNFPFLLFNPDAQNPGPPARMGGPEVPVALIQESQIASDEIKAVTGIFDPSLGEQSNETSGRAITARQKQGEIATYNYMDNMAKGIRRTWEILIDLLPKIYDTERSVRILGVDLSEKYQKINAMVQDPATGEMQAINDLSRGKYDVTVTVGPSFATQRQEATELYTQLGTAVPQLWAVAGDLIMKSMDLPYADKMAERMKLMLPPQIQQAEADGKPLPPEVQQAMQQADQMMQVAQQQSQLVQQAAQEVQQSDAELDKKKAEIQTLIQNLKTEEARFEAKVEKVKAQFAQQEAQSAQAEAAKGQDGERENLSQELQSALVDIKRESVEFTKQVLATLADIMSKQQTQVVVPASPRIKAILKQNGPAGSSFVPQYEDQTQ